MSRFSSMRFFYRFEIVLISILAVLVGLGWYLSESSPQYFADTYIAEDGVIEVLSVVALVAAAGVCLGRMVRLWEVRSRKFLFGCAFLAAGFLFGAGEELSWGQRIFNVESPEFFQTHNSQAETNLHNLVLGGVRINKVVFGALLAVIIVTYVLVMPPLYRRKEKLRRLIDGWGLPVPRVPHALVYLAGTLLVELVRSNRNGELRELIGCTMFFLVVLYPMNREIFTKTGYVIKK